MDNTIFYFTGTGSSLAIAKKIINEIDDYQLVAIASLWDSNEIIIKGNKVGFIFPLYFAGLPHIVKEFIKKIRFEKECYIFAVVACGFPWSGFAINQLNNYLRKKKQKLSAGFYVPMIDNFLVKYNIPSMEKQEILYQKCDEKLKTIVDIIRKQDIYIEHERGFFLYLMYPMFLRFIHSYDALFKTDGKCNSCCICEKVCPVNNIKICNDTPRWLHKCEFCMACINYCPQKTIQWGCFTNKRGRYHHKDISIKEIIDQKN